MAITRRGFCASMFAFGGALFVGPSVAFADQDLVVRVQFGGWSGVNPDAFLVKVLDQARGNRYLVRQIGNPAPTATAPFTPETERAVIAGPHIAPWSFVVPGYPGLSAPNGWKVFGQPEGGIVRIGVTNGRQSVQIGLVKAKVDVNTGKPAKTKVTTAYWSKDSKRVVVVVNHKIGGAWAMDIDEAHGFKIN